MKISILLKQNQKYLKELDTSAKSKIGAGKDAEKKKQEPVSMLSPEEAKFMIGKDNQKKFNREISFVNDPTIQTMDKIIKLKKMIH